MQTRGYLLVATVSKPFYDALVMCVESLKDEVPDAKVAVYTHEAWVTDEDRKLFDHLITPVPVHVRTKLWALSRTPFDITCYLDVDGFVLSDEIEEVFDLLGDNELKQFWLGDHANQSETVGIEVVGVDPSPVEFSQSLIGEHLPNSKFGIFLGATQNKRFDNKPKRLFGKKDQDMF